MKNIKLSFSKDKIIINYEDLLEYKKIKEVSIPKNIKQFGIGLFSNKEFLEKVYFEKDSKVTIIPDYCFKNCLKLKKINLPSNLVTIDKKAFLNCISLETLELPDSIIYVDSTAFDGFKEYQKIITPIELKKPITCKAQIILKDKNKNIINDNKFNKLNELDDILKYYLIKVKCGHVGRDKYMPITFPIKAFNKKEAVQKVKNYPRVKRNHKDVILEVNQVSYVDYKKQIEINNNDPYLHIKRKKDQKEIIEELKDRFKKEENYKRR